LLGFNEPAKVVDLLLLRFKAPFDLNGHGSRRRQVLSRGQLYEHDTHNGPNRSNPLRISLFDFHRFSLELVVFTFPALSSFCTSPGAIFHCLVCVYLSILFAYSRQNKHTIIFIASSSHSNGLISDEGFAYVVVRSCC
jgi:hypothetical protein